MSDPRSAPLGEPLFSRWSARGFVGGSWRPIEAASAATGPSALRVLTWNVLFDRYEGDRIHTARRRPHLLRRIAEADADVIALQETERPFLRQLLAEPWVRARYVASDGPRGARIAPYGVVLLSRAPVVALAAHELDPHKKLVAMTVRAAGRAIPIVTLHLTSDHASRGPEKRVEQLAKLREGLDGIDDAVVLGDFNEDGDLPRTMLHARDAWTELHGERDASTPERWATFDPPRNPLAAICSASGQPLRLDRVLLRGRVRATRIERIGTEPIEDGLFPSDHYGLLADLSF
jgi:endonuclease/exonuclease/phosphatase family metal-dependent hydrolase